MDKKECLIIRNKKDYGYAIVMLHDNTIRQSSLGLIVTKENIIDLVKHPYEVDCKDNIPMFKIGLVSEESIRKTYPIYKYTRLILEYDNENEDRNLIEKFVDKFKKYSFILYTTFNSTEYKPKFRVLLKLKYNVDYRIFKNKDVVKELVKRFTIDDNEPDKSCFLNTQFQYLPCKKKKGMYKYIVNKGKKYNLFGKDEFKNKDVDMFNLMVNYNLKINAIKMDSSREEEIVNRLNMYKQGVRKSVVDKEIKLNYRMTKEQYAYLICNASYEHRFNFLFNVAPLYKNGVFDLEEIKELCVKATGRVMEDKHIKKLMQLEGLLKRGSHESA